VLLVPLAAVLVLLAGRPALAQAPAGAASWKPSDCQTCHDKATGPAFSHSKHAGLDQSCASCHDNVADHFKAQSNGDANGPVPSLKKLTANQLNATCPKCHEKAGQANNWRACTRAETWPAPSATASTTTIRSAAS